TMPIWDMNQGAVIKARGERDTQAARVTATRREVEFNVFDAYLKADLAKRQLELLKQSLEEANELLHLAHLRYGEGELDFLKYLDEVKTVNETRVRYYEGLYNLSSALTDLESIIYGSLRKERYLQ
nr:TolC family protein [Candidatus Omnitrophota bacterium]